MITIQVYNPFKGSDEDRTIDITEVIEQEKFEAAKKFISDHLKFGLKEAKQSEGWTDYDTTQMEYLITQLYQPSTIVSLVEKILKYQGVLYKVKQYNEVINYLKGATNE